MSEINPTPARYWKRKDDSIGVSFGNPIEGYHEQFDFDGSEELAAFVVEAVNSVFPLIEERDRLREALVSIAEMRWSEDADLDDICSLAEAALSPPTAEGREP
jgi:hypothetical protein